MKKREDKRGLEKKREEQKIREKKREDGSGR